MNRRATLAMTTTALVCLAVGLSASDALAQQKSLKEQIVGTWTLVSSDQVRPDGTKLRQFGSDPKGINVFDANGRFFVMIASADNLQIASIGRSKTNSEEDGLIVESIAYYGTYTVNEDVTVISLHLDASTFPNQVGTDQKRTITSLTAGELKYSSPAAISGVQVLIVGQIFWALEEAPPRVLQHCIPGTIEAIAASYCRSGNTYRGYPHGDS